jgi:chromatin remodeling complex protein RSC6
MARYSNRASGASGLAKKVHVSAALAHIVGSAPQARTSITKKLWAYIKKHKLQDANDGRIIHADEALHAVIGRNKVSMLEMTKLVSKHIR